VKLTKQKDGLEINLNKLKERETKVKKQIAKITLNPAVRDLTPVNSTNPNLGRRSPIWGGTGSREGVAEEKQLYPTIIPKVTTADHGDSKEVQESNTSYHEDEEEYAQQLIVLKEMGFTNRSFCKKLLRENNGNIQMVALLQSQRF